MCIYIYIYFILHVLSFLIFYFIYSKMLFLGFSMQDMESFGEKETHASKQEICLGVVKPRYNINPGHSVYISESTLI